MSTSDKSSTLSPAKAAQRNNSNNNLILVWQFPMNSLAPGRSECDSKNGIFNLVLLTGVFRSSHDNALQWTPQDLTDDKSTLVHVMAWCRQAISHYLNQCWLSPLSPYGITRPQWVKRQRKINYTHGCQPPKNFFSILLENSVFWVNFPYPLICSTSYSKHSLWQLPIALVGTMSI